MRFQLLVIMTGSMVAAATGVTTAWAQKFDPLPTPPIPFAAPPQVATDKIDPQLKDVADLLGIIRTGGLTVGNMNILEYNAHGVMTDWETPGAKEGQVENYTFNVSLFDN